MADLMERMKKEILKFAIMLVGQSGAGKSSLILRYIHNKFTTNIATTIGIDFLEKKLKHKNKRVTLELWDTSGQQIFRAISEIRYKRSNAMIFVYDLNETKSREQMISYWIPTALESCPKGTIFAVFGNKSDLVQNPEKINEVKEIVDKQLHKIQDQLKIEFMHYVGNCKEDQNTAINDMIGEMVEKLCGKTQKEEQKKVQESILMKQREKIQQPPVRKSIILAADDFKVTQKKKKQKKCGLF